MTEKKNKPRVVTGMKSVRLTKDEYRERFLQRFYDPAFDSAKKEIDVLFEIAWEGYSESRKSPRKKNAGKGFSDPEFPLPVEWLETRRQIHKAERNHRGQNHDHAF